MSLLLDALKRAEQEKLARQGEQPGAQAPHVPEAKSGAGKFELESMAPSGAAASAPPARPAPGERAGAQTVFVAKHDLRSRPSSARWPLFAAAAVIVLLVVGGGAYLWIQLSALGPKPVASAAVQRAARVPAVKPVTPAAAPDAQALALAPAPSTPPASAVPAAPPVALLRPETVSPEVKKVRPAADAAEQLVLNLLRESAPRSAAPPLKLTRSLEPARVQPEIAAGYEALKRGDLGAARRSYQSALDGDATNLDALLGLATVEARSGDRGAAMRHFRRVLTLDARNGAALAGLAALADFSRPGALEASLRADIARYPQSAALQMTLGNLYASQSRWPEAQAAFFEAHRLDPANADVLYNLAVALDNLGQVRLAADFYLRALGRARAQPVQFDARAAERRLADLKP